MRKKILITLSILLLTTITAVAFLYKKDNPKIDTQNITIVEKDLTPEKELWLENKSINGDYQGEIIFESGLINKSFVQAKSCYKPDGEKYRFFSRDGYLITNTEGFTGNDVYIWTNWKTMEYDFNNEGGSVFMDSRNDLTYDQNIIIYGHHFSESLGYDPERIKAFTPLEKLLKEENYKNNKIVKLNLGTEIRTYELVSVYIYDNSKENDRENLQYFRTNYNYDDFTGNENSNYYDNYIKQVKEKQLYKVGSEWTTKDKTLTLQTCISGENDKFEIVIFKLINTVNI